MTPVFTCGFECGLALHGFMLSDGASISTATVRTGNRSLRINPSNTVGYYYSFSSVPESNIFVIRFYVNFSSLPTTDCGISGVGITGFSNVLGAVFKSSDSKIYAGYANSGSILNGATGVTITTGVWYLIDIKVNISANPWLVDVSVDNVSCGQYSNATAASTSTNFGFGVNPGNETFDAFFDDWIVSQTSGDYPIGAGKVLGFVANADGTHTSTGTTTAKGTLATPVGAAITAATTDVFNWVNGRPLLGGATDNTRLVNAVTAAAATYVEVDFQNTTETTAPRAVEIITADRQAGTAVGVMEVRLNDNGTENTIMTRTGAGVITDRFVIKQYATMVGGGDWTLERFNALKARFGYSSDATPDQYWRGIMIEAEFAEDVLLSRMFAFINGS